MSYWLVKPIINGFEMTMVFYSEEESLKEYITNVLGVTTSYRVIEPEIVSALSAMGFKIYSTAPKIAQQTEQTEQETEIIGVPD